MNVNDLDLVLRSLDDELSPPEQERVRHLLAESAEVRHEMDQYAEVRQLVARHGGGAFAPYFADRVMRRYRSSVRENSGYRLNTFFQHLLTLRTLGWSVAVVLFVSIGLSILYRPHDITVPYGARITVTLPDGSSVQLSSGSGIQYRWLPGQRTRRVKLTGEAFFDVRKSNKPFEVETFNSRVTVKGTRFNVRAWDHEMDRQTVVTLETGRVLVTAIRQPGRSIELSPGQMTRIREGAAGLSKEDARIDQVIMWRTGGLAFSDQTLGNTFRELERRFGMDVSLVDPALAGLRVTYLNPHPATAEDVLSDLCHAHGLNYRRTANGFQVFAR